MPWDSSTSSSDVKPQQPPYPPQQYAPQGSVQSSIQDRAASLQDAPPTVDEDERAIARYRYLLRTAPPQKIEGAHAEAFARLSVEQRQQVLAQLSTDLPEAERPHSDDPREMARAATRGEVQQPGFMQPSFGTGGGMGMGGLVAGSMLGTIAGVVIGSTAADSLFGGYDQSPEAGQAGDAARDTGDQSGDPGDGTEYGSSTDGQEAGNNADYSGGDFGDGDFGGGDF